ncbi:uncharacterized protein LOC106667957 isoform X3 [Cimex lectularius]|uniref:Uncharacterized protein n=1 Tax=Cimex lectularius TaxID=79782 RepID=A0A8I6TIE2_CIMLE|nr:uncharacterized protein LOC106667957 isoform X3 [Cimex lectularius]
MPNIFKWRTLVIIENKCVLCIKDFYFSNFILADKMNCIRVRTCCFMCSVTTGSKIFGWVITLASTAGIIYLAATFNDVFTPPVSIAGLTFAGLVLFGGVTLLVGIYSESSNAVLGALIVLVLVFLGAVALAVPFAEGYITGKVSFMKTLPSFAGIILLILVYAYALVVINNARLLITEQFIREDQDVVLVINRKGGGTRKLGRKAKRLWLKEGKLKKFRGKKRKIRMRSLTNMPSFYLRPKKEKPISVTVGGSPVNTDVVVNLELPEPEVASCVQPPHVIVHQDPAQILVMQPPPEPPPAIVEQVPVPVPIVYPPTKCDCDPGIPEYPDPMPPYCTDSNEHLRHSSYADRKVLPQFIC